MYQESWGGETAKAYATVMERGQQALSEFAFLNNVIWLEEWTLMRKIALEI